jgi:hypothetical protein
MKELHSHCVGGSQNIGDVVKVNFAKRIPTAMSTKCGPSTHRGVDSSGLEQIC